MLLKTEKSSLDPLQIRIHSCHLHSVYQVMNSSRKSTSGAKSVFFGLTLLQKTLVLSLRSPKNRSTELRNPKVWCTWFRNPARLTASRYRGHLSVSITGSPRHLPLNLRRNLSAFPVVLVSDTPNQMGCLV